MVTLSYQFDGYFNDVVSYQIVLFQEQPYIELYIVVFTTKRGNKNVGEKKPVN